MASERMGTTERGEWPPSFEWRRTTPRKGTSAREELEQRWTEIGARCDAATKRVVGIDELLKRTKRDSKRWQQLKQQREEARDEEKRVYGDEKEVHRLWYAARLEDRVEEEDPAPRAIALVRLIEKADGTLSPELIQWRTAQLQPLAEEAVAKAPLATEASQAVKDVTVQRLVMDGLYDHAAILARGLQETANGCLRCELTKERRTEAIRKIESLDALGEAPGWNPSPHRRAIERLNSGCLEDIPRIVEEYEKLNQQGLEVRAVREKAEAAAARAEAARVESLREPPSAAALAAIGKLTTDEKRLLEAVDLSADPVSLETARVRFEKKGEKAIARLEQRGLVKGHELTEAGVNLARAYQRQLDRLDVGVPFAEYEPAKRGIEQSVGSWRVVEINGKTIHTDGSALIVGQPPKRATEPTETLASISEEVIRNCFSSAVPASALEPVAYVKQRGDLRTDGYVVLSNRTALAADYFEYIRNRHPEAQMASRSDSAVRHAHAWRDHVVFHEGGHVVAVLCPLGCETLPRGVENILAERNETTPRENAGRGDDKTAAEVRSSPSDPGPAPSNESLDRAADVGLRNASATLEPETALREAYGSCRERGLTKAAALVEQAAATLAVERSQERGVTR